jgi:hypothetical protein
MKKALILFALVAITTPAFAETLQDEPELGVTFDVQYLSKWLSKGFPVYGSHGAVFTKVDLDFYQTGFGLRLVHRNSTSSGYVDRHRFDFRPYYKSIFFEGEPYATKYDISVGYEYYYGLASHKANTTWEWIFNCSWPNLIPGGLVPGYIVHYEYPATGGERFRHISGWAHRFRLAYPMETELLQKPLVLSSELVYNDGLGGLTHDWTHATFGIATNFDIAENLTLSPALYYQISMDDAINDQNELYTIIGLRYKF